MYIYCMVLANCFIIFTPTMGTVVTQMGGAMYITLLFTRHGSEGPEIFWATNGRGLTVSVAGDDPMVEALKYARTGFGLELTRDQVLQAIDPYNDLLGARAAFVVHLGPTPPDFTLSPSVAAEEPTWQPYHEHVPEPGRRSFGSGRKISKVFLAAMDELYLGP